MNNVCIPRELVAKKVGPQNWQLRLRTVVTWIASFIARWHTHLISIYLPTCPVQRKPQGMIILAENNYDPVFGLSRSTSNLSIRVLYMPPGDSSTAIYQAMIQHNGIDILSDHLVLLGAA